MRPRSALPLPRYTLRKPLKTGWAYFFNVPMWAREAGCPIKNEPLGTDYEAAVARAETVLLPAFDSWRTGGASDAPASAVAATGTSIGFLVSTVLTGGSPSWMIRRSAITRLASGWLAATFLRMVVALVRHV